MKRKEGATKKIIFPKQETKSTQQRELQLF